MGYTIYIQQTLTKKVHTLTKTSHHKDVDNVNFIRTPREGNSFKITELAYIQKNWDNSQQ